jgi:hypothetical protein
VRQLVGYDRYEGEMAYRQLAELYRAVRLYVNFFQPSMKLLTKRRNGSRVQRTYHTAQTPHQRLMASGPLTSAQIEHLGRVFRALDPVRLLQQIQALQDALWRHAVHDTATPAGNGSQPPVRFSLSTCMPREEAMAQDQDVNLVPPTVETTGAVQKRKYHRVKKSLAPRTWRTRPDPFAAVDAELHQQFLDTPDRTAKALFQELQERYPGQYADGLLRTLQRRVHGWRRQMILAFDDHLVGEDALLNDLHPTTLRAIPTTSLSPTLPAL